MKGKESSPKTQSILGLREELPANPPVLVPPQNFPSLMGPFSSHHLITYYIRSFHTINSPYEPISLAEIIIKVFVFLSSSAVGDWRRGESLCLCAQLNILRKLFVVWWKCCVLEMIRGYFVRALESFSFSAVYFWIRGFRLQCQPDRTGWAGVGCRGNVDD